MKERLKIIVPYSISIGALIALVLLFVFSGRKRIDSNTCARIKPGMTQRQVEAILGGPPGEYGTGRREIVIDGDSPFLRDEWVEDWGGDDGIIQVRFDKRGRVISADFKSDELWAGPGRPARQKTIIERWLGISLW